MRACNGDRLKPEVLAVLVHGHSIADASRLSLGDAQEYFATARAHRPRGEDRRPGAARDPRAAGLPPPGRPELPQPRRSAGSLSGGEAQRIRLATQIGSGLTGVLYVLDEPSIGLHQRDNRRLIETLLTLRDLGNTLIVVEHDEETIHAADWVVDIGPGAGVNGGHVVHSGPLRRSCSTEHAVDHGRLPRRPRGRSRRRRSAGRIDKKRMITSSRARARTTSRNVTVEFPLGVMTAVTGVSGSGKSSLVNDILYEVLATRLNGARRSPASTRA